MSKAETKMPYQVAIGIAQNLVDALTPFCERILIAGSLRRKKAEVGDIEIVAIPKAEPLRDMFGLIVGQQSLLDAELARLGITCTKDGGKFKQFAFEGAPVDLFLPTRETWGCIATIRTGSADFTHWLVTPRKSGGGCYSHMSFKEGRLMEGAIARDTREERQLFEILDQEWIEPIHRAEGRWHK